MAKQLGTLDVIKQSGKKFLDNIDPIGMTTAAGLGGLAGYLYDQSQGETDINLLRSALRTGGGAALGLGVYTLADLLTGKKALIQSPESRPPIAEVDPVFTPLAVLGGGLLGRSIQQKGWGLSEVAKARRALNRRIAELKKANNTDPNSDAEYRRLSNDLKNALRRDPWGRGWRDLGAAYQKNGLRASLRNLRTGGRAGAWRFIKQHGVRGWLPKPYSAPVLGATAALLLSSSPYVRQKLYDWTLDY